MLPGLELLMEGNEVAVHAPCSVQPRRIGLSLERPGFGFYPCVPSVVDTSLDQGPSRQNSPSEKMRASSQGSIITSIWSWRSATTVKNSSATLIDSHPDDTTDNKRAHSIAVNQ